MQISAVDFVAVLLFCFIFSLVLHEMQKAVNVPVMRAIVTGDVGSKNGPIRNYVEFEPFIKEMSNATHQFFSAYDVFRSNMSAYDRILYVQRNYNQYDSEERRNLLFQRISTLNEVNNIRPRDVVFQNMADTGLGNNLLALASSFIISRILNASFHVNWPAYVHTFNPPLVQIESNLTYGLNPPSYTRWKIRWNTCKPSLKDLGSKNLSELIPEPNLIITAYYDFSNRMLPTSRYDSLLEQAGLSPSFDASAVTHDPVAADALHRTFYTEFPMMTSVRLFFSPNVFIQEVVDRVLSHARGYHLIGFQIRMGSGGADFTDSHTFLTIDAIQKFVELGEAYRIQRGIHPSRVKWFISTDSSKAERKLRQLYPERILVVSGLHRGHSQQVSSSLSSFQRATADLSVLSHCEYLVLTNHSSFGMVARMISPNPLFSIVPARGY